jgi:peptide/nickel transport system ATP-binding protein
LCEDVFKHPAHPYTKALISASLIPEPGCVQNRIATSSEIPGSMEIPKGCGFYDRCQKRTNKCRYTAPFEYTLDNGHTVSCHNHTPGGDV